MRKNGVLLPVSSLPSPYGIGTLGQAAYDFVDYLKGANQSYWQILPVCPTSYGDSPYASYSTFAGNPYFIDLDLLAKDGLLEPADYEEIEWGSVPDRVDYGAMYNNRYPVLKKAVAKFLEKPDAEFEQFKKDNAKWLDAYALFMALKDKFGGASWQEWPEEYRMYEAEKAAKWAEEEKDAVEYNKALQYLFFKQWNALRKYANDNDIEIIGDLPIYVAMDSSDAWSQPELFELDDNRVPKRVAGVPPDGFSADGQLWGNPLYDWDNHRKSEYEWWTNRIEHLANLYNILRIDHFRGFESYFAVPYGEKTARNGEWVQGPGAELFRVVENKLGKQNIIAEDLGYLTPAVKQMLADTGYPGMKILEFGFDSRDASSEEYLPYNYPHNSIAYTGTHDNDTIQGWVKSIDPYDLDLAKRYLRLDDPEKYHWEMIEALMASPSDTSIVMAQDLLGLGSEARLNEPSTVGKNWQWRLKPGQLDKDIQKQLGDMTALYRRIPHESLEVLEIGDER